MIEIGEETRSGQGGNAPDRRPLWSYLFGTAEPPRNEAVEHGHLEHLHWDRRSRRWTDHEETSEEIAA